MTSRRPIQGLLLLSLQCLQLQLQLQLLCLCCRTRAWVLPNTAPHRKITHKHATDSHDATDATDEYKYDDTDAKSQFGTKEYWDETYQGRGDFPMDEYQWYFGFEEYGKFIESHCTKDAEVLIPGIGNDPILLDLLQKGYHRLTATDYSEFAMDRQQDLLSHEQYPFVTELIDDDNTNTNNSDPPPIRPIMLLQMDARKMPPQWTHKFDTIIEKGALDAIYLSGDGNVELAKAEFERILKPGGILISVSGVVPMELRKDIFQDWNWIRDGSQDLAAGCFILQKPTTSSI